MPEGTLAPQGGTAKLVEKKSQVEVQTNLLSKEVARLEEKVAQLPMALHAVLREEPLPENVKKEDPSLVPAAFSIYEIADRVREQLRFIGYIMENLEV